MPNWPAPSIPMMDIDEKLRELDALKAKGPVKLSDLVNFVLFAECYIDSIQESERKRTARRLIYESSKRVEGAEVVR